MRASALAANSEQPGQRRPTRCIVPAFGDGDQAFALSFLAALRARRTASAFSRVLRSDGFSYALRRFISRKTPSRCIFFLRTLRACSTLLSRTNTCKMFPIVVAHRDVSDSIRPSSNIGAVRGSRKGLDRDV